LFLTLTNSSSNATIWFVYDVIVVGAGIGGAAAAYFLGRTEQQVLVLEKEALPRYKACGGGVPKSVFRCFPFPFDEVVESEIAGVRFSYSGRKEFAFPLPAKSVAMVMRDRFDAFVLSQARAEIRDSTKVVGIAEERDRVRVSTADGRELAARYLLGADGANSVVARALGLRQRKVLGAAIEAEVQVDGRTLAQYAQTALFEFGAVPSGYLWIFPKRKHLSVGIAVFGKSRADLRGILRREMARFGIRLDGTPLHAHPLPVYWYHEKLATERTLLVGDAAGLVDPFLGEGIRYAVRSADLAAEAIAEGQVRAYTSGVQQEIGADLRRARWLARLVYGLPRFWFLLGIRSPGMIQIFADMLDERISYFDISKCISLALLGISKQRPTCMKPDQHRR
jgi:geranylgeranyl reductase family protein